jgi:hypothetical protein
MMAGKMSTTATKHVGADFGTESFALAWARALPLLALVGPGSWLAAALVRAAGLGTLSGELEWVSLPEGFIMVLGVPFFVATFVMLGGAVAVRYPRTGVAVTAMGILGVAPLAAVSAIRVFMGAFVAHGLDPSLLHRAFESPSLWYLGFFVLNAGQFLAWIVAAVALWRGRLAPRWVAACLCLGVVSVITAQGAYFALEIFWPLGCASWLAGVWGLMRARA